MQSNLDTARSLTYCPRHLHCSCQEPWTLGISVRAEVCLRALEIRRFEIPPLRGIGITQDWRHCILSTEKRKTKIQHSPSPEKMQTNQPNEAPSKFFFNSLTLK